MKLYRIRRKSDGRCFAGWIAPWSKRHRGKTNWTYAGVFYKRIDTVQHHLTCLNSDWTLKEYPFHSGRHDRANTIVTKFHPERLAEFEVLVDDVKLMGSETIEATQLVGGSGS